MDRDEMAAMNKAVVAEFRSNDGVVGGMYDGTLTTRRCVTSGARPSWFCRNAPTATFTRELTCVALDTLNLGPDCAPVGQR